MKVLIAIILIHLSFNSIASLLSTSRINSELKQFQNETDSYMNTPATKTTTGSTYFSNSDVMSSNYVTIKAKFRTKILPKTKSGYRKNDLVEALVDTQNIEKNIVKMDSRSLLNGKVNNTPWSDDYWPIYKGILGNRYADEEFDFLSEWLEGFNYIKRNEASIIYQTQDKSQIDRLSPSEKYDLLINGQSFFLTKKMWADGRGYYNSSGNVETWMGICHGWAPASYMLPRPTKKVTVKSFDGTIDINFYPSDIKALASLLWANVRTTTRFVGGRCRKNYPQTDEDSGRVIDKDCHDTNAGTWHMSVVNQVGISKLSFVMDATYDYEVWNQPVISYHYKYFNPITNEAVNNIQDAIVEVKNHKEDKFKKYRSRKAKYLVGISMEVEYGVESTPLQRDIETSEYDSTNLAFYLYDLELDKNKNIIGGEWYKNTHPDFLWTPPKDTRAITNSDYYILSERNWSGKEPLSKRWKDLATSVARRGQPLARIVESLIDLSK